MTGIFGMIGKGGSLMMALSLCLSGPTMAQTATPPTIEHIGMQLFGLYSGTLSKDIAPPAEFDGWNTVIGEGSAEEAADDMLVTIRLRGAPEAGGFTPLIIEARDGKGKLRARRTANPYLTDIEGKAYAALWLHDIGCAGKLTVTARMGKVVRSSSVNLDCGE